MEDDKRIWTTIAAVVIAAPIGVLMRDLKPDATGVLLAFAAVMVAGTWRQPGSGNAVVRRLLLAAVVWLAVVIVAYTIAIAVAPPIANDQYHHVMPVEQAFAAFVIGCASAIGALIALYRPLRTNPREESAMLAIVVGVAIVGWAVELAGWW